MSDKGSRAEHQQEAEAEVQRFHDQLGPFVVTAKTTRMPMVFANAKEPDPPIIFAKNSVLGLLGYEHDEVLGQGFVPAGATRRPGRVGDGGGGVRERGR